MCRAINREELGYGLPAHHPLHLYIHSPRRKRNGRAPFAKPELTCSGRPFAIRE
jgi:hypothetical protein